MDPVTPMDRWARRRDRTRRSARLTRVLAAVILLVFAVLGTVGVELYTDALWFESIGYISVFATTLTTQVALFAAGLLLFLSLYLISALLARRLAYRFEGYTNHEGEGMWAFIARVGTRSTEQMAYRRIINAGIVLLGLFLATIMGMVAAGQWAQVLRFTNQISFGITDPIFGRDVGFYVFTLPFLRFAHSWLLGAVILVATSSLAVYAVVSAYELGISMERAAFALPRAIKAHLAALAAMVMLLMGWNHLLDLTELVYSNRGATYGVSYADIRAQVPGLWLMFGAALGAAALILSTIGTRGWRPAVVGVLGWGVISLIFGLLVPNAVEQFEVKPNQLEKERPYIENNIEFTLQAFGLREVTEQFFPAEDAVTAEEVRANPETVSNARLWDNRPLRETFNQIQSIRTYYTFDDVDIDRYTVRGATRQVMVAAREIAPEGLSPQARTWVNQRLKFTHGYGVAMSLVSAVAEEGRPSLLIQDVPPAGEIPIQRPEIYYGQHASNYVIVKTTEPEFDYPRGEQNVESRYQADSGVGIGSLPRRLAYGIHFRDGNLLLSSALGSESTILYRRTLRERIQRLAPFLLLDRDPYIVIADGRLIWMQDAYTYTNAYPYSQPALWRYQGFAGLWMNYIRNSVKIAVDAYDGSVEFYVADPSDPIIATYQRAFPAMFKPMGDMPAALRSHIRYPEDLFTIQANTYQTYHMTDASVFYNREDQWEFPKEKFYAAEQRVEPYYVIMRLEGQPREEFLLMLPFTPRGKDNMIAWLAGRSDEPNYGKLLVYKLPKDKLIYGPFQVEGRIDQDPIISSQFTLWSQAGSRVIRGNMLVIPVGRSNLYVEPIYLQAENGPIPELKRVILGTGNRLVMEPTLEEAVAKLFGPASAQGLGPLAGVPPSDPAVLVDGVPAGVLDLVRSARGHFERSQEALRTGDWGRYGEEQRLLEADLRRLGELTGR